MSAPDPAVIEHVLELGFKHLLANKYYILGSTIMLLYDHLLTLGDEIDLVWRAKISLPTCCFFIFCYATPITSILNLVAEHSPHWNGSVCKNWIWLPVAIGPIISASTGGQ